MGLAVVVVVVASSVGETLSDCSGGGCSFGNGGSGGDEGGDEGTVAVVREVV